MSKRASDQSTSAKAKITKWLIPRKARKESRESIKDEEKPEQRVVSEKITETKVHTPSTSSSVQVTSIEAKEDKNSIPQYIGQSHITTAFSKMAPFPSRTRVRQTCSMCS